jgi:hypothetical protein
MFILAVLVESSLGADPTPTLQQQLIKENISNLSRDAREKATPPEELWLFIGRIWLVFAAIRLGMILISMAQILPN